MKTLDDLKREATKYVFEINTPSHSRNDFVIYLHQYIDHLHAQGLLMVWQPIETAPRRTPFIATGATEVPCVVTTTAPETEKAGYPFCCYHTQVCFHKSKFTHWMQLPKLPEETKC